MTGRRAPAPFDRPADPARWGAEALIEKMRAWQPDMAINERCALPCDFDTPEQRVGEYRPDHPGNRPSRSTRQWAYRFDQSGIDKEVIGCRRRGRGSGDFVVNIGPNQHGTIHGTGTGAERVGAWLDMYGHTIYGTRRRPWPRWLWAGGEQLGARPTGPSWTTRSSCA